MKSKLLELVPNTAKSIDLLTEKDSGNEVRILTGKSERSIEFWKQLRILCDTALNELGHQRQFISTKITLIDKNPEADQTPQVVLVEGDCDGLNIQPVGYGDSASENGFGWPILLEKFSGKLRLVVWADINQCDPTHIIDLAGAKELCREPAHIDSQYGMNASVPTKCPNCSGEREWAGTYQNNVPEAVCHFCGVIIPDNNSKP
ncbi:MAG: hypothetical protein WC375_00280 [Methanomassiliicoccales archaeon]|jgi:hypothetical protein